VVCFFSVLASYPCIVTVCIFKEVSKFPFQEILIRPSRTLYETSVFQPSIRSGLNSSRDLLGKREVGLYDKDLYASPTTPPPLPLSRPRARSSPGMSFCNRKPQFRDGLPDSIIVYRPGRRP